MDIFQFSDELGPDKIVGIYDPSTKLHAIVVVDNVACGPSIGGMRMAPDVSAEECFRLARAMTFKNAAAGIPHGGGKSVIFGDPHMPISEKEHLIRAFARGVAQITDYIVGPDMGTDEQAMAWIHDEIGRSVGLPREIGGIPLDEIGATGFGIAAAAEVAQKFLDLDLTKARLAVQGFGAVGHHAAKFLTKKGAVLVAASDSKGTLYCADGLDVDALAAVKSEGGALSDYDGGEHFDRDHIVGVPCDIWIPAARPDVITRKNVDRLNTRLILQGANIPITSEAEDWLHEKGILSVPDFIANAGGVICAAVEYQGGSEAQALNVIQEKISFNTHEVLSKASSLSISPRTAAVRLARERVEKAMSVRWKFGNASSFNLSNNEPTT